MLSYRVVCGEHDDVRVQLGDKAVSLPEIVRRGAPGAEARRRGAPGQVGDQGGGHRPGLLQRRAAAGHQGRRADRRAGRAADPQRAHRCGAGLRLRKAGEREDRRLRPRGRHAGRQRPGGGQGRVRRGGHRRRHLPGRGGLRQPDHREPGDGLRPGARGRPAQGADGAAAPEGRGGAGQERALRAPGDQHQPPLPLHPARGDLRHPPADHPDPRPAGGADRRPGGAHGADRPASPGRRQGRARRSSGRSSWWEG